MWYLSGQPNKTAKRLSMCLLDKNGWEDQFSITKKVLHQYSAAVDFFNSQNLDRRHKLNIVRHSVDSAIVEWHIINYFKIKENEFINVALNGYTLGDKFVEPKIPRTYKHVLHTEYQIPTTGFNLQTELDKMSNSVIIEQMNHMGLQNALKYQNSIASEEAGELTKELSKYYRYFVAGNKKKMAETRLTIIDEMFDTMYTRRYVFQSAEITKDELNKYAEIRIPEIYTREITYKGR